MVFLKVTIVLAGVAAALALAVADPIEETQVQS